MLVESMLDIALKDELYKLRTKISLENNIYNELDIYTKVTIEEIATYYPETMEELSQIAGIGKKRLEKYGGQILELVKKYIADNNLDVSGKKKHLKEEVIKEYDQELYEILTMALLKKSAEEEISNTNYLMIPQVAIMEICREYPLTEEKLIKIYGIGTRRYQLFGKTILEQVQTYVEENADKVKENLKRYATYNKKTNILRMESDAIKNELIAYAIEYPILECRVNLLINAIYSMQKNYEKTDAIRLIAGGELKTLIRNVVEPLLNYALKNNTSTIEVVSKLVNNTESRRELIMKYKIMPEELDAINMLYNYANGCDHIFDAINKSEKQKNKSYIIKFETLNKEKRDQVYLYTLQLIKKMIKDDKVVAKFEALVNKGI